MIQNLGERIQNLRKEANLSQESLAEQLGVSRQAISKWERNEATPDVYNLSGLAEVFNVSIDELINEDGETKVRKATFVRLDLKKKSELLIIGAIVASGIATFAFLILPFSELMNLVVYGVVLAIAIGTIIYGGTLNQRFRMLNDLDIYGKKANENNQVYNNNLSRRASLISLVSIIALAIYLYLGFVKVLWHPGWIVFFIVPIAFALYEVIASLFSHRDSSNT